MSFTSQIWPDEYCTFDAETAWKFVLKCKTWNEAEKAVQPFPDKEFLNCATHHWVHAVKNGEPLVVEKCRRMVISWLFRSLELWRMGAERFEHVLCGLDFEAAASHCWRYSHMYDQLKRDNPGWNLPEASVIRAKGDRYLESFALPNRSITTTSNAQGGKLQGEGKSLVTLEELSRYRYPSQIWAQAKILTQGAAGSGTRGAVVAVSNAYLNSEWKLIKKLHAN